MEIVWLSSEVLPKIWGFFEEIYIKSITPKIEGPNQDNFGDLPFH